jgi:hypothetical protein
MPTGVWTNGAGFSLQMNHVSRSGSIHLIFAKECLDDRENAMLNAALRLNCSYFYLHFCYRYFSEKPRVRLILRLSVVLLILSTAIETVQDLAVFWTWSLKFCKPENVFSNKDFRLTWSGIIDNNLIEPHVLPQDLNGEEYLISFTKCAKCPFG